MDQNDIIIGGELRMEQWIAKITATLAAAQQALQENLIRREAAVNTKEAQLAAWEAHLREYETHLYGWDAWIAERMEEIQFIDSQRFAATAAYNSQQDATAVQLHQQQQPPNSSSCSSSTAAATAAKEISEDGSGGGATE